MGVVIGVIYVGQKKLPDSSPLHWAKDNQETLVGQRFKAEQSRYSALKKVDPKPMPLLKTTKDLPCARARSPPPRIQVCRMRIGRSHAPLRLRVQWASVFKSHHK